jgi:hypothetical protein
LVTIGPPGIGAWPLRIALGLRRNTRKSSSRLARTIRVGPRFPPNLIRFFRRYSTTRPSPDRPRRRTRACVAGRWPGGRGFWRRQGGRGTLLLLRGVVVVCDDPLAHDVVDSVGETRPAGVELARDRAQHHANVSDPFSADGPHGAAARGIRRGGGSAFHRAAGPRAILARENHIRQLRS